MLAIIGQLGESNKRPTEHVEVAGIRGDGTRDISGAPSPKILLSSFPRNSIK